MTQTRTVGLLSKFAAVICVSLGAGVSTANACLENMDFVKTTTTLMWNAEYGVAYEYTVENLDVCPAQARFFAAQIIIEGHKDDPVCEAVSMLEEAFHFNNERNSVAVLREANENSILQLLNWAYVERYVELSMIEGNAYSVKLFLRANQERFKDVLDATNDGNFSHRRLKQLLTYAEYLQVDLKEFPELLKLTGEDFVRDGYLIKNGWPKKLICDARLRQE